MDLTAETAFLGSNGCPENLLDTGRLKEYLIISGWKISDGPENARISFFNACGLTEISEELALKAINDLKSRMPAGSRLIIWGCLPKINPKALESVSDGPIFGEKELFSQIADIIHSDLPAAEAISNQICPFYAVPKNWIIKSASIFKKAVAQKYIANDRKFNLYRVGDSSIFYIKISSGCLGHCTYCAIRNSRGKITSKPIEAILKEFKSGLGLGYREFSLMGTDLGGQGHDRGYDLSVLLKEMTREKGDYKIGLRNANPSLLRPMLDDLEPVLKTGKIWFIGLPAESGSNRILKTMGRQYTIKDYNECIKRLKAAWPPIIIRNQMLVGFPGETQQDFAASMKLIENGDIDFSEVHYYSIRPSTPAAKLSGHVSAGTKQWRRYRMLVKTLLHNTKKNKEPVPPGDPLSSTAAVRRWLA